MSEELPRVVVTGYVDRARGTMTEHGDGGHFTEVVLRPEVTVASPEMVPDAERLRPLAARLARDRQPGIQCLFGFVVVALLAVHPRDRAVDPWRLLRAPKQRGLL